MIVLNIFIIFLLITFGNCENCLEEWKRETFKCYKKEKMDDCQNCFLQAKVNIKNSLII